MLTVAVSGATGFIGSRLVGRLGDSADFRVRAFHRDSSVTGGRQHRLDRVRWVRADNLLDEAALRTALRGVDIAVHLAGSASGSGDRESVGGDAGADEATMSVNAQMAVSFYRAARDAGVRRYLFVSSAKVHGEISGDEPFTETSPFAPATDYAKSKVESELALSALDDGRLESVVVRPPMVYGPEATGNVRTLARLARLPVPKPLGIGANARSVLHVDNLVDFLLLCFRHPEAASQTFLVKDDEDLSTRELLRCLAQGQGRPPLLVPMPPSLLRGIGSLLGRRDLITRLTDSLQVDSAKATSRLGWTPAIAAREGLTAVAATF